MAFGFEVVVQHARSEESCPSQFPRGHDSLGWRSWGIAALSRQQPAAAKALAEAGGEDRKVTAAAGAEGEVSAGTWCELACACSWLGPQSTVLGYANVFPVHVCSERESALTLQSTHLDRMRPARSGTLEHNRLIRGHSLWSPSFRADPSISLAFEQQQAAGWQQRPRPNPRSKRKR